LTLKYSPSELNLHFIDCNYVWLTVFRVAANGGSMASKGLREIVYQGTRKFEAVYKPSHTTETFIGYTA